MTHRLSPEREAEIRLIRKEDRDSCHWGHVGELLNEIDALREENQKLKGKECEQIARVKFGLEQSIEFSLKSYE